MENGKEYYVVVSHSYHRDVPDEVEVVSGPFRTHEEAEASLRSTYEESWMHDADVELDDESWRVDIDEGQDGVYSWLIAERRI